MTKFSVAEEPTSLKIRIEDIGEKQGQLLQALQECAEGRCTCPTNQYEKLQKIDIAPREGDIEVSLVPRDGESIDRAEIERCLEYTAARLGNAPK